MPAPASHLVPLPQVTPTPRRVHAGDGGEKKVHELAVTPRSVDFAQWYSDVIIKGELGRATRGSHSGDVGGELLGSSESSSSVLQCTGLFCSLRCRASLSTRCFFCEARLHMNEYCTVMNGGNKRKKKE